VRFANIAPLTTEEAMKKLIVAVAVVLLMAVLAFAKTTEKPAITKAQASAIALEKAHGKILSAELEREHGHLVWSFDIQTAPKKITEVQVDAKNGKIVAVEEETPEHEAKEQKQEKEEKKH
jgi:uncharacterized membrane protein YkoI